MHINTSCFVFLVSSPADGNPTSPGMAVKLEPERWKAMVWLLFFF